MKCVVAGMVYEEESLTGVAAIGADEIFHDKANQLNIQVDAVNRFMKTEAGTFKQYGNSDCDPLVVVVCVKVLKDTAEF